MKQIRRAKPKDIPGIVGVAASTKIFTQEELDCVKQDAEDFFSIPNNEFFFVYEEDKKILGFVQCGPLAITNNSWCLYWIAVDKTTQGKGVGKKLLSKAEKEVKKLGARVLFIETSSRVEYDDTRAFYMKCNYMPVCSIPDFYNIYDNKVIFSHNFMAETIVDARKMRN